MYFLNQCDSLWVFICLCPLFIFPPLMFLRKPPHFADYRTKEALQLCQCSYMYSTEKISHYMTLSCKSLVTMEVKRKINNNIINNKFNIYYTSILLNRVLIFSYKFLQIISNSDKPPDITHSSFILIVGYCRTEVLKFS